MVDQITNTEPSEDVEQGDCTIPDISSLPVDDEALRRQIMSIGGHEVEGVAVLSFRALQLYRIAILQAELTRKQSVAMKQGRAGRADWKIIDELLQSYADAIRNYETLSQDIVSDKSINYDFLSENEQFHVIRRKGHKWRVWHRPGLTVEPASLSRSIGPLGFRELDKKGRVERERRRAYASRLSMALFGGVALISPMLIMVLHPGLVVDLVTASVATVVFAFIIAVWLRDASGKDVLASTAAYAAVLVVFVGVQV